MRIFAVIGCVVALGAANVARAERTFLKCDFTDAKAKDKKQVATQIFSFDEQSFQFWTGQGWSSGIKSGWSFDYRWRPTSLVWSAEGCNDSTDGVMRTCTSQIFIDRRSGEFSWDEGHGVPGGFKKTRQAVGTCSATTEPTYVAPPPAPTKF